MSYQVNPSAWGAAFPVPSQIVDKHIRMAGVTQLKALLWLLRHSSEEINVDDLSAAIGQQRADTVDALHYWVENGILICSGTPGSPVQQEAAGFEKAAAAYKEDHNFAEVSGECPVKKSLSPLPVAKPNYEQIAARACESPEITFLFNEAQVRLGRTIGYEGQCALLMMHDQYGLPVEVILMILEYVVSINKISYSYIASIGRDWGEKEIDTIEKADEQITNLRTSNTLWKQFAAAAGISNTRPTGAQLAYVKSWGNELGFDAEMIYLAYEQMANHCQRLSLPYIDKVLKTWHKEGIKTPEDVEKASQARSSQKVKKQNGNDSNASYGLEDFKHNSLHNPIVYEKRKK